MSARNPALRAACGLVALSFLLCGAALWRLAPHLVGAWLGSGLLAPLARPALLAVSLAWLGTGTLEPGLEGPEDELMAA